MRLNPYGDFKEECKTRTQEAIESLYPGVKAKVVISKAPPAYADLSTSVAFELSKIVNEEPFSIASKIAEIVSKKTHELIDEVTVAKPGYVNFRVNYPEFAGLVIKAALQDSYGFIKTNKPLRVIVEHTSANPVHPIHIGTARGPFIGDAIARMLTLRGHSVKRHFYVNDIGRQIAIAAYGYGKVVNKIEESGKVDHFIGRVYSITNCLIEVVKLREEIKRETNLERRAKLQRELDNWLSLASEFKEKYPELFDYLLNEITKSSSPDLDVRKLARDYEFKTDEKAVALIRTLVNRCLDGFRQTLSRLGVEFDSWDWECELVWSGEVKRVLNELKKTPYVSQLGNILEFNTEKAARELGLKNLLDISGSVNLSSLTLTRSDGTTLYTTRDIAYSIWKFKHADRVINVIGVEQSLAQLQVRVALAVLGYKEHAKNLTHLAYGLVEIPGYKMSGRRGKYITIDQVIEEAVERAYREVDIRSSNLPEGEKRKIAEHIGIGAIKYALLSIEPIKNLVFMWDRVLDFEKNSAPFIQYAHARACSILRKAGEDIKIEEVDFSLLSHKLEKELIMQIAEFPEVFIEASEYLRPNLIAEYANNLAMKFNSFYSSLSVLKAEDKLATARLALVKATRNTLKNALYVLGITPLERM